MTQQTDIDSPVRVLEQKLAHHNGCVPADRLACLSVLKAVYRRGEEDYLTNPRPGVTCDQFAQTRVTRYLQALRQDTALSAFADTDLLPVGHTLAQSDCTF